MSSQTSATIETVPTEALVTDDYDIRGNDYGEVPVVCGKTVLTNGPAIQARKSKLANARGNVEEADLTTERDKLNRYKEQIIELETSTVIRIPCEIDESKRDIIGDLVDADISDADERLLSAILFASSNKQVTAITVCNRVVQFELEDDTYIEATCLGDGIVIQGRERDDGRDVCRSFPETCLQEEDTLNAIRDLLSPDNGWAAL